MLQHHYDVAVTLVWRHWHYVIVSAFCGSWETIQYTGFKVILWWKSDVSFELFIFSYINIKKSTYSDEFYTTEVFILPKHFLLM